MTSPDFSSYLPEQFKEHPDFPGIWIGNQGTILTTRKGAGNRYKKQDPYGAKPHPVKIYNSNPGYLGCCVGYVHRLVAQVWIPNPDNLPEVNHKDEDKLNNCVENLEWCTREYNQNYGTRNTRISSANKIALKGNQNSKGKQNAKGHKDNGHFGKNLYRCPDGKKRFLFPDEAKELGLI